MCERKDWITGYQMQTLIQDAVKKAGSLRSFSQDKISKGTVSHVINRDKPASPALGAMIGYERVILWRPLNK